MGDKPCDWSLANTFKAPGLSTTANKCVSMVVQSNQDQVTIIITNTIVVKYGEMKNKNGKQIKNKNCK